MCVCVCFNPLILMDCLDHRVVAAELAVVKRTKAHKAPMNPNLLYHGVGDICRYLSILFFAQENGDCPNTTNI